MNYSLVSAIETIQFHGDTILVARIRGKGYAGLKAMCGSLGIDDRTQRRKLKGVKWCREVIMTSRDSAGRMQRIVMIPLTAVPMWLATIHPSKVAFEVRVKLETYQLEAAMVLAAWFEGPAAERMERMILLDSEIKAMKNQIADLTTQNENARTYMQFERKMRLEGAAKLADVAATLASIMKPFQTYSHEYLTVKDFCAKYGVLGEDGKRMSPSKFSAIGKRLTALSKGLNVAIMQVNDGYGKTTNAYGIGILNFWRNDIDLRNRTEKKVYAKFVQPRLFAC